MQLSTPPSRLIARLVLAAGVVVVLWMSPAVTVDVEEASVQEIVPEVNTTVPQVSFDGVDTGNESSEGTRTPGISPLPVVPADDGDSGETPDSVLRGFEQSG